MKLRQGGILPRWSYAALTNILPEEIISEYKKLGTDLPVRYYLNTDVMHTYVFIHDLEDYEVVNDIPKRLFQTSAGNWLDAAFEMVCKLKEEKYI